MRYSKILTLIGIISTGFVLSTTSTQAAVVHDNGGPLVSFITGVSDVDGDSRAADNFTLTGSATITNITWSGVYFPSNRPNGHDDFTIRFYTDSAGLPDNAGLIGTYTPGNAVNRVYSGVTSGLLGFDFFNYSVDITPLMLSAGTYWISIVNDTTADTDDNWYWSVSSVSITGGGDAVSQGGTTPNWTSSNVEHSFVLSNDVAAVPVPAAVWLMGSALAGLLGFSRCKPEIA